MPMSGRNYPDIGEKVEKSIMATVKILSGGRPLTNTQIRASTTGNFGSWESTTDRNGECHFSDNANRVRIEYKGAYRWIQIGEVQSSLRGNITVSN